MPPQPVVDTVGETNQYFDLATFECHNVSNAFSLEMGCGVQWCVVVYSDGGSGQYQGVQVVLAVERTCDRKGVTELMLLMMCSQLL